MRSKYRYLARMCRNVAMLGETKTDEYPGRRHRCRLPQDSRPCSPDLPEKRHAAPKCTRETRERNAQSDSPVSRACLLWSRLAHGNKPKLYVCPQELASCRTDSVGPAEQMDDRASCPFRTAFSEAAISSKLPPRCTRRRSQTIVSLPWNGGVQRVIHLESRSAITVSSELPLVALGQSLAANLEKLVWSQVTKTQVIPRQCRQTLDLR